jgi:[ribosomal protein S5]-alanine N-acetyltransferase
MLKLNFSPFPTMITERLLLRRITGQDAGAMFYLRSNESVMKYIDRPRAVSLKDAEDFVDILNRSVDANESICWGIALKETPGQLVGYIGYWRMKPEHYRAEIGYALHHDFWRQGITREVILAVIDYGFNTMNLHSIEANINAENMASAALLESVGFIKEAHFKEDFFFDGIFRDTIIYSLLQK